MSLPPATLGQLSRVRWSLTALFGLFGVAQTSWMGRLPSIREAIDISDGQLGTILVVAAIGSLIGVTLVGHVTVRLGSAMTLVISSAASLVGFGLLGVGVLLGSTPLFIIGLLGNGLANPGQNVPINLESARVEKPLGKTILPHVHAAFSVGALAGAGLAALTAAANIHAGWHVIGVIAVVTVGRAVLIRPGTELQAPPHRGQNLSGQTRDKSGSLRAWTEPRTLMIGVVILAATMSEGAAANWMSLAVVDSFQTREALGALAYGTFVVAMLGVRLVGPGLVERLGRVALLRASGAAALAGLLAFGLGPNLAVVWVGIILWGAGAALAWPLGTAAAADDPSRAAGRVAVTNSMASIASLSFPPVLGLLSDSWGIRNALLLITAAMVLSILAAGHARPQPPTVTATLPPARRK
ncbi:MAG: MFS transporter [Promicromonosporaceae bacterium]|nr:MFS transporter [Promicromonosporaceae bacterium]